MHWCGVWCKWISFAGTAMIMFVMGAFLTDRDLPFVRYGGHITPTHPRPGDYVDVHWDADLKRVCPGKINRTWTDGDGDEFDLQSSEARYMQRGKFESMSTVRVPAAATCGRNRYTAEARYECNVTHKFWPLYSKESIYVDVPCEEPNGPAPRN